MLKQGFTILDEWDNGSALNCHILLKKNAFKMPEALAHDLRQGLRDLWRRF